VKKIRQSASQMMVLSRTFPLLIGDRIPVGDKNWESWLLLLKICSIALSPICTHDTVAYLRVLVEEKLDTFKTGVTIRWTGLLDWTTGLDYWTHGGTNTVHRWTQ